MTSSCPCSFSPPLSRVRRDTLLFSASTCGESTRHFCPRPTILPGATSRPPSPRGEEWCDPATKTHINDTPAYYYNYAFATVFKFQLHDYIARKILHQPPQSCNYADNREIGTWLNNILKKGATEDWRKVLKEATGEDISTRAMMDYFQPLMSWLEEQNKGRQIGWE